MSAVQKMEVTEHSMSVPQLSETAAVLSMIERAARDPAVDIDKMVRLLELRDKMEDRARSDAFDAAMASCQAAMRPIAADSNNPQTKSRYASYHALDKALRPIYSKHGFSLSFDTADGAPEGCVRIVCDVAMGGHTRRKHIDMPADGKGAKGGDVMTKTHATGAAVSYGSRYLLRMIFNVAVGESDNDGNATGEAIDEKQAAIIRELIDTKIVGTEARLLKWARVERIEDIPAARYADAVEKLQSVQAAS